MPIETEQDAAAALAATASQEFGNEQTPQATQSESTQTGDQSTQQTQTTQEELPFDLSGLDAATQEEIKKGYLRQADYTRKTQEAAEIRKQYEGIDPNLARQAIEFATRLDQDANFQREVYDKLNSYYGQSQQVQEPAPTNQEDVGFGTDDEEFRIPPQLEQTINDIQQRLAMREQQDVQAQWANKLASDEATLRQSHPDWQEEHWNAVFDLAYSTGGDLIKAGEKFDAYSQNVIGGYIKAKEAAPGNIAPGSGNTTGDSPRVFHSIDEAHGPAMEALRNALAN